MDMELTEEQKLIQQTARQFAETELEPLAAEHDQHGASPTFYANLRRLAELGFVGMGVGEQYGGAAAGAVALSVAITELGRACAATAVTVAVNNMVAEVIQALGTEEQRHTYLPRLCSGEFLAGAFALTEAQAGSDPAAMSTTAIQEGTGWCLNGAKVLITSAPFAAIYLVWAVTDEQAARGKGISLFLVDADCEGVEVGQVEEKMGQRASPTSELVLSNCRVSENSLLGPLHGGFGVAVRELSGGRINIGSLALGIGVAAMDSATRHALQRRQFGRNISELQAIQWKIADSYTELEAARLLLLQAACCRERGGVCIKEAAMAKLFATEAANRACYEALQIFGGYGYLKGFAVERYSRDVRVTTLYEGTSEIQRFIIAREILASFS